MTGIYKVMLAAAAISVLAVSVGFAADANAPAMKPEMKLQGMVSVVKDANGVVTAVKLTAADKVVYNVMMDKVGMELSKMDGKEVEAQTMKHGADIMVMNFKLVEKPKAEAKPAAKPKTEEKPKPKQ